jgi:hypothetical protein
MAPGPNAASNRSGESEYFPSSNNDEIGFGDDESLTALEKIYLFSRSKNSFHRVFIVHALPAFLDQISSQEAVDYVLPLLSGLAIDEGELAAFRCVFVLIDAGTNRGFCERGFGTGTWQDYVVVLCRTLFSLFPIKCDVGILIFQRVPSSSIVK